MSFPHLHVSNFVKLTLPEGFLVPRSWFTELNISRHKIDNLVKSGQITSVFQGVYGKPPIELTWKSVVCSLQTKFNLDLVVGGITALELNGFGHYMPLTKHTWIHLFGTTGMPYWLNQAVDGVDFVYHNNQGLLGKGNKKWNSNNLKGFSEPYQWREGRPPILISSPERAILEVLTEVPKKISFEHADQLMQSMTALSPVKLQDLLEHCENIKVRRLFFWLADRHNWTWLKKIDRSKIDLGNGKRVLEKNGVLDKTYNITVPKSI